MVFACFVGGEMHTLMLWNVLLLEGLTVVDSGIHQFAPLLTHPRFTPPHFHTPMFHLTQVGFERYNVPEMNDVVDLVNKGLVKVHLSETLPLGSCAEAMQRVGQGHTRGKVALTL